MSHGRWTVASSVLLLVLCAPAAVGDGKSSGRFKALLSGYAEVPAISSRASGWFEAGVGRDEIRYSLRYRHLDSGVIFAHIHFGQRGVNGGVSAFLCSNLQVPVTTPPCPATGGRVSGVITAGDVVGPQAQGISAGEFNELVAAIRAGTAYVNVHTNDFAAGEVRGQIGRGFTRH